MNAGGWLTMALPWWDRGFAICTVQDLLAYRIPTSPPTETPPRVGTVEHGGRSVPIYDFRGPCGWPAKIGSCPAIAIVEVSVRGASGEAIGLVVDATRPVDEVKRGSANLATLVSTAELSASLRFLIALQRPAAPSAATT